MAQVASYVFFDIETTSLPAQDNNKTRITELSMLAVRRDHLLETRPGQAPRVQKKITLCFNPGRIIHPDAQETTGLDNFLLEFESIFNIEVTATINSFLNLCTKPVCLIAHNGFNFDFPILKNHIESSNASLSDDLLCADSYLCFYDVLERDTTTVQNLNAETKDDPSCSVEKLKSAQHTTDKLVLTQEDKSLENSKSNTIDNLSCSIEKSNSDVYTSMQKENETTPTQTTRRIEPITPCKHNGKHRAQVRKVRRKFPWSVGERPKISYKLKDIYERLLNRPAIDAHRAEVDCVLLLECAVVISKKFSDWVDNNHERFIDVKPMRNGVPIGD